MELKRARGTLIACTRHAAEGQAAKMRPLSSAALAATFAATACLAQPPPGCPNGGVQNVVYNLSAAAAWEARPLQNTSRSGRPLRLLEPPDGACLHGAGQDPWDFANYAAFMSNASAAPAAPLTPPLLFMSYVQLSDLNATTGVPGFFTSLNNSLACYGAGGAGAGVFMLPQLGVAMTLDDGDGKTPPYDDKVARGDFDYAIAQLVVGLRALGGRPLLMRIGYEFNGIWNRYGNATFIEAWGRIHAAVRAEPALARVAFVWDYSCDEPDNPWTRFEMPDSMIDWYGVWDSLRLLENDETVGHQLTHRSTHTYHPHEKKTLGLRSQVNVFSNSSSPAVESTTCLRPFLDFARARGFPVIVAESTPRYVGAAAADGAWEKWFGPLVALVSEYDDVLKAWCYASTGQGEPACRPPPTRPPGTTHPLFPPLSPPLSRLTGTGRSFLSGIMQVP